MARQPEGDTGEIRRFKLSKRVLAVLWIDKADNWRSEKIDNVSSTPHAVADS